MNSSFPLPWGEGPGGEGRGAEAPRLWITDFGLARINTPSPLRGEGRGEGAWGDAASLTMTGDILGTLRYMSPEQLQAKHGVLDHRTDIYSLGLTLYELLTLEPAFPGDDRQNLIRQIAAADPPPPRQFNHHTPKDLETIVLKAIAKEPEARYATAQALGDDLRRFVEDKPIRARRPSLATRAAKWARRHKAAVGGAAILIVAAAIGFAVSTWLIWRENQDTKRATALAQRNADIARAERDRAEENLLQARQAVDDYFTLVSENTILDAPGLQPLRKDLLKAAIEYYERFVKRQSDDPKIQAELAVTHLRLAQVRFQTGSEDCFFPTLAKGVGLAEKLIREHPNAVDLHLKLAGFWHGGRMNVTQSQPFSDDFEAVRILQEAIDLWERFAQKHRTVTGFRSDLSKFYDLIAPKQCAIGQPEQGLRSQKKCREIREEIVRTNPGVPEHIAELAYAYQHLADRLENSHPDEAEKLHHQSLNVQRDLPNLPTYQDGLGWSYRCLARFLRQQNRLEEAAEALLQSSAIYEKLAVQFSYATLYRGMADSYQVEAHLYRAKHYAHANDLERATTELDKAVELAAGKAWAGAGNRIAWLLVAGPEKLRDAEKALPLAQQAVEAQPQSYLYRNTLGVVYYRLRQYDHAVETLQKAISLNKNDGAAWDFLFLAMAHHQLSQTDLARSEYEKALGWMKEHPQKEKDQADELEMFRREAEELLGIGEKPKGGNEKPK